MQRGFDGAATATRPARSVSLASQGGVVEAPSLLQLLAPIRHVLRSPANCLTLGRVALAPLLVHLILEGRLEAAFLLFLCMAISDILDGWIARRMGQETMFGQLLDPMADKVVVGMTMVVLVHGHLLSPWMVAMTVAREFSVQGLRNIALQSDITIAASVGGKAKTVLQHTGILVAMAAHSFAAGFASPLMMLADFCMWTSLAIGLASGSMYLYNFLIVLHVGKDE